MPLIPEWLSLKSDILFDTNLLVVIIVGKTRSTLLGKAPVKDYDIEDFDLLVRLTDLFRATITTPYILAETNSLLNRSSFRDELREELANQIPALEEIRFISSDLSEDPAFAQYGLTDISVLKASGKDTFVLSADRPLVGFLLKHGIDAMCYEDFVSIVKGSE